MLVEILAIIIAHILCGIIVGLLMDLRATRRTDNTDIAAYTILGFIIPIIAIIVIISDNIKRTK